MYGLQVAAPLTVILIVNLHMWNLTLERFATASTVDFGTNRHILHEMHETDQARKIEREASL